MPEIEIPLAGPRKPITVNVPEGMTMQDARQKLLARGDLSLEEIGFQTATPGVGPLPADSKPLDAPIRAGLIEAGQFVDTLGARVGTLFGNDEDTAAFHEAERLMQPLREEHPVATTVGSALPGLAIPGGFAAQIGGGILEGVLSTPENPLIGGSLALGGGLFGKFGGDALLQKVTSNRMAREGRKFNIEPSEQVRARGQARQFAEAANIPLTTAERTDSAVARFFDRQASTVLGRRVGGPSKQRALNKTFARSIGDNEADALTGDVLSRAAQRYGSVFEEVANTVDEIPLTQTLSDEIGRLEGLAEELQPNARGRAMLDQLTDMSAGDRLTGKEYNRLRSQWSRLSRNEWRAGGAGDPISGEFMDEVIGVLDGALAEVNPDIASSIANARSGWRQLLGIRRGSALDAAGNVNPVTMARNMENVYPGLDLNRFSPGKVGAAQRANLAAQWFPPEASSRTAERSILSNPVAIGGAITDALTGGAGTAGAGNISRELVLQTGLLVNDTANGLMNYFNNDEIDTALIAAD